MTARHRRAVLVEVRKQLSAGQPVWLVSTSLIEAGLISAFRGCSARLDALRHRLGKGPRDSVLSRQAGDGIIDVARAWCEGLAQ